MGHFYTKVKAVGKNREEAESAAVSDFFYEHGHRHNLRGVESATLIRKVPPKKEVREQKPNPFNRYGNLTTFISQVDDPDAPPEKWLEEWEFELHTHA